MRLTVHEFVSLDGVVQGPGSPDEDRSDGFERGGWVVPYGDQGFGEIVDSWFARTEAILLGRTTYDLFRGFWPQVTDPDDHVAATINGRPRYVVSSTLTEVAWPGTTVLTGVEDVAELKAQEGGELQVHGSCRLVQSLHAAGLVDEYRLIVFPVVLGQGRRLFPDGAPASGFALAESRTTPAGCTYSVLTPTPFDVGAYGVEDGKDVTL